MTMTEQALRELQEQAARVPGQGSDPTLDAILEAPYTGEGVEEYSGMMPAGVYLAQLIKLTPGISQVRTDPMTGEQKGGNRYINLAWKVIAGERANQQIFDIVMLEGKGTQRFHVLASAVGLWDKVAKRYTGGKLAGLLGRYAWVKVVHRNEKDQNGNDMVRDRVDFAGYMPLSEFQIPPEVAHLFGGGNQTPSTAAPASSPPAAAQTGPQAAPPPAAPQTVAPAGQGAQVPW